MLNQPLSDQDIIETQGSLKQSRLRNQVKAKQTCIQAFCSGLFVCMRMCTLVY